ncbi:MAG: PorV/PorQ family protein [bacterium]
MENAKWKMLAVIILLGYSLNVDAAIYKKAGTTVGQVLEFGVGARACAMGEAFTGLADDFSAFYWNPAGIAQIEDLEFNFMHNDWFQGIRYELVSTVLPLEEELGAMGLSIIVLKADDIVGRDTNGNFTSNFEAKDSVMSLSFGQRWNDKILIGATIKRINLHIENEGGTQFAFDAGGLYKFQNTDLTLGAVVQNIGKKIKFIEKEERLPLNFKLGILYKMLEKRVLLTSDLSKSIDRALKLNLGTEIIINSITKFRFGYNSTNDADNGFTAGIGLKIKDIIELDYAYIPYGELGDSQRISLTTKFKVE